MLTIDTSGLIALTDATDAHGRAAIEAFVDDGGPYLIPAAILSEIAYVLDRRVGGVAVTAFLEDLDDRSYSLDCGEHDAPRIVELMGRYADLELGFADAAVIACAERNGGRVLSLDRRDFDVVAREGSITVLP